MEEEKKDNSEMPSDELERARKIVLDYLENEGKKEEIALAFPNQENVDDVDIALDESAPVEAVIYESLLPLVEEEEKKEIEKKAIEEIQKEKDLALEIAKKQEKETREKNEIEIKKKEAEELVLLNKQEEKRREELEIKKTEEENEPSGAEAMAGEEKEEQIFIPKSEFVQVEVLPEVETDVNDKKDKEMNFFPKGLFTADAIITYLLIFVLAVSCIWMVFKYSIQ